MQARMANPAPSVPGAFDALKTFGWRASDKRLRTC
jgi:hypothetical protein